jgi:hypothetical protein
MENNEAGAFLNITPDVLKKLDSFDEKLEKIEKHAHTAADALKNGFGSVVMDTSKLESVITSLAKKIDAIKGNPFEGAGKGAEETTRKTTSLNESLSRAADLLNRIGNNKIGEGSFANFNISGLKQGYSDLKKYVENMDLSKPQQKAAVEAMRYMKMELDEQRKTDEQRAQSKEKETERRIAADRRAYKASADLAKAQNYKQNTTAQGALDFSKTANTLQRQITAIEYLKKARLSLNTTDANYKSTLEQINQAIAKHNQALTEAGVKSQQLATRHRNLMDTAGQLSRQLALLFSVSQIEGYIRKIVEVRGQFELQQVALRAILQDKDKADKIFSQTMQQALKSPFQAMQLVTFTKQLAAYRIESDKLFDTTKRLADVSAGLGVDIQRLILAYGQVKAAAYLRGTEVRQFTEAGINLYGELQSYFEEVKGEAYTTAQIVDMISKRMVKFEDVEAVFQRMTDKGGLFYNMQEVQVNTLHGQINRLKDVISIMQNEIGKSNQEGFLSISTAINLANTLLENWRMVASVLKTIITAYGTFKTVSGAMWIAERIYMTKGIAMQKTRISLKFKEIMATRTQTAATVGATAAQNGLNMAVAKNPYGAILAVITAVGVAIYEVIQNTNRLKEALDGIAAEGAFSVVQSSNNYVKLASVVTDSTKSYQEHNKALAELKKKYSDILPEQYLNAEGIKALNGNYNEAIKLIHQYINAKTKERMIDEVGQDANKEIYSNQQKTAKAISEIIDEQHGMKVSWSEISGILSQVQEKLLSGAITSTKQLREETEKVVEQYTGLGNIDLSDYFTQLSGNSFGGANKFRFDNIQIERSEFKDWFESTRSYISQVESIEQRFSKGSISMTAQRYQEQKDATEKMVANAMNAYDVLRDSQKENTKVTKDELEYARELVQKVLKAIGSDVQVDSAYINKLFNDSFFFEEEKQKATQTKLKQLFDKLTKEAKESGDTSGAVWLQEFEKQINGLNLNPLQNSIKKFLLGINGNADIQANWNIRSGETEAEFKKRIKTEIDTRNEIIRKSQSTIYPEYGQDTNKVKSELEELNRLYNELGGDKNKSRSSAERDIWAERISVLKEMQSRYEKLNQLMGENRAIEETRSAFKGALDFTQMGEVIKAEDIIPTKQGMIDALEKLLKQIPNDVKNAAKRTGLEKEIAELKIGIQQDYLKEQLDKTKQNIEDMFNGLDLHQKLKDAGLSEAEVQQLFPGLAKTLDDVEKGIEEEFNKLRDVNGQLGKDEQKDYEDRIAKLNQQRVKEQQDTIERLIKSYKTQFSEQLQLDEQYYKDLSEIRDKFQNAPDLQKRLEENATKMYNKKSANNAWKEFTSSDSYLNLFDNIEYYSTAALQSMKDKLVKMREELKDLSPTELKQIMEQEEKLDKQLNQRDPWNKLTKSLKEYTKLRKENAKNEKDEAKARDLQAKYEKQLRTQSKIVAEKKAAYESATENIDAALEEYEVEQNNYDLLVDKKKKQDEIVAGYDAANRALSQQAQKLQGIIQSLGKIDMGGGMVESISGITNSVSDFAHMLEDSFGVAIGEDLYEILDGVGALFDSLESFDITKPISSSLNVLTGLGKTIGSIFGIGNKNKKKEREIQRQIKNIESLGRAYDELKEKMEAAWSADDLRTQTKDTIANLDQQIESYENMINSEEAKKDSDRDRIDEWNDAINELKKTRQEILDQQKLELGGIGGESEYKDAASSFVQAWMDAFNETEDGLKALNENFDSFIENLIVKQATMRLAQGRLKELFEKIDESVTEGSVGGINLTKEELANIQALGESALKGLNEDLLALMETLGYKGTSVGQKSELSALTQSIQGVSETTAGALEALLNSIRFFVNQQTTDIAAIRVLLEARYSLESQSGESNPMIVELRAQTRYLEILSDRIDRVFAPSPNSKGPALRVVMQ